MKLAAIDLFCGAGGLTHGLVSQGVPVVAGIDVDPACRYPFETNNAAKFIEKDVSKVKAQELEDLFGDADIRILAGCAPCQPFSPYAQRYETIGSPRWALLYQFARLIKQLRPQIVTMENVPTVDKHVVYHDFVASLEKAGYQVWQDVIDCSEHGLPQRRKRRVLLASLLAPVDPILPSRAKQATVRDAISGLPAIKAGEAHPRDPLHASASLSQLNLARIKASKPGGTWRDWPEHLVADCHQRDSGHTYPGVYGRMSWDAPAPTMTTQFFGFGSGRFGHPQQDRALSLREGAILQGFPRNYEFIPPGTTVPMKTLGRLIGNAVPVTLGRVIGKAILKHVAEHGSEVAGHSVAREARGGRKVDAQSKAHRA